MPVRPFSPVAGFADSLLRPLALASLLVSALATAGCALLALLAWSLADSSTWRDLLAQAWGQQWPGSVLWLLSRPVQVCLWGMLLCALATLSSWGLYRWRRWGLYSFVLVLLSSIAANFVLAEWVDGLFAQLQSLAHDPALQQSMWVSRLWAGLLLYGGSLLLLLFYAGLCWQLLRPDVRRQFH